MDESAALFKKLNLKAEPVVFVVNEPESFRTPKTWLGERLTAVDDIRQGSFAMLFATKQAELDHWIPLLDAKLEGDAILWCCYPKGSSKKYKCDFNRDTGWTVLGQLGYEPVRQVAIDDDWSALRFRRVDYIKTLTRSKDFALTETAKKRTSGK